MTTISPNDIKWLLQRTGAEPGIYLLTAESLEWGEAIHYARSPNDVTSRGKVFLKSWFDITESDDTDGSPTVRILLPNVDREIGLLITETNTEINVTIELVRESAPDTVVQAYRRLVVRNIRSDKSAITGELSVISSSNEPCFNTKIAPRDFPGFYI